MQESESESEVTQLFSTVSDPMDRSLPGSSVHGIFQARGLEWGAIAFSGHYQLGFEIEHRGMQLCDTVSNSSDRT